MTDGYRGRAQTLVERLLLALRLDLDVYTQVSADRGASFQAFMVVALSGVFNGVGLARRFGGLGVWAGVFTAIAGWFLWTLVLLCVAWLFRCRRDGRSLLRALGFANAPEILLVIGGTPLVVWLVRFLVVCWLLAATTVALQAVYAISRRRALAVMLVGFVAYMVIGAGTGYLARPSEDESRPPAADAQASVRPPGPVADHSRGSVGRHQNTAAVHSNPSPLVLNIAV